MATCPMPWFPIYASEMLGDEDFISWSPEERGCWITLSARCWADGSIPADIDRMAKLCGCNAQAMLKHWSSIASKFEKVDSTERYTSRRIEIERNLAIEKSEKLSRRGKAGAATRWCDEKRDMLKQCLSNPKAMLDDATLPLPLPLPLEKNTPLTPQGGPDGFQAFWDAYPHRNGQKKNRKGAEAKFAKAIKSGVSAEQIMAGVRAMMADPDVQRGYARDAATWLNQEGWKDERKEGARPALTVIPRAPHISREFEMVLRGYGM